jgi:hypothetical protein
VDFPTILFTHPDSALKKTPSYRWLTPVVLAIQEAEIRRISVQSQPQANKETLISKIPNKKQGWGSGSSGKPSKREALSSNPSTL